MYYDSTLEYLLQCLGKFLRQKNNNDNKILNSKFMVTISQNIDKRLILRKKASIIPIKTPTFLRNKPRKSFLNNQIGISKSL